MGLFMPSMVQRELRQVLMRERDRLAEDGNGLLVIRQQFSGRRTKGAPDISSCGFGDCV
jgi:mRNA degradation ribonuclease J1/J2